MYHSLKNYINVDKLVCLKCMCMCANCTSISLYFYTLIEKELIFDFWKLRKNFYVTTRK